ncbi:lysozyme inhibitor LprI family protein [Burkholderia sp. Ac-20365]|uniref:lysozyme inhibitor LprI family protein n=1 Tax=Burkholderia sp. Ac-20365 TaxID=2703897 RepID=UPI00197BECE2|nr:lysozyme inhibitor LprI family protein [Burkholderia sp. Ac-20365]MBN3759474.1 DUF1311 domain-containing protein [Burkholderia sp. Ac-20365]
MKIVRSDAIDVSRCIAVMVCFVSFSVGAQEEVYLKQFNKCSKIYLSQEVSDECVNSEISFQKKRLNFAYARLMERLGPADKIYFDRVQRAWISWRDANYSFLAEHVAGEFSTTRTTSLQFLLKSIFDRANEIEMILDEAGANLSHVK